MGIQKTVVNDKKEKYLSFKNNVQEEFMYFIN